MYLHNNQEIPDIASKGDDIPAAHFRVVDVTALSIVSAAELTTLSIQQRRCQYLHESTLLLNPVYSYNLCRMDCRVRLIHQLCGCVPYFYWTVERLLQHEVAGTCRCLPPCDDTTYLVDTNSGIDWLDK
ncbi:hypothetical protein J6590_009762 [Homalodisca vitripennis]|nr:hypothetical protein J6590_009762 [Homalodisca vitripennis]